MRRFISAMVSVGALASAVGTASAQSITLGENKLITRKVGFRPDKYKKYWVNQYDCRQGDVITFSTTLSAYNGLNLEVWAGTGTKCTDIAQRQAGSTATCWRVFLGSPGAVTQPVAIYARNIVAKALPIVGMTSTVVPEADASVCEGSTGRQQIALYFMLTDTAENIQNNATVTWSDGGYDIAPPAAPTGVTSGAGEGRIHLAWTRSTDSDILGYNFYCDSGGLTGLLLPDGGLAAAGPPFGLLAPGLPDGSVVTVSDASLGSGGAGAGGAGGLGTAGAGGVGGLGAAGAGASPGLDAGVRDSGVSIGHLDGGAIASCGIQTPLVPGTDPPLTGYYCGTVNGITAATGTATGLTNGQAYVVSVATVDTVGNVGLLSNDVCATPIQITDFFELYKQSGGKGGGGFCSISRRDRTSRGLFFGLSALGAAALLRRARRRRV